MYVYCIFIIQITFLQLLGLYVAISLDHEHIINLPIHLLAILLTSEPIINLTVHSLVITISIHLHHTYIVLFKYKNYKLLYTWVLYNKQKCLSNYLTFYTPFNTIKITFN